MALSDVGPALMKMSKNRYFRPILWCQKSRSLRKTAEQSHLDRHIATISWYRSQEVTIYEQLVQLILMEAFTLGVDRDVASEKLWRRRSQWLIITCWRGRKATH